MPTRAWFPTLIYHEPLLRAGLHRHTRPGVLGFAAGLLVFDVNQCAHDPFLQRFKPHREIDRLDVLGEASD